MLQLGFPRKLTHCVQRKQPPLYFRGRAVYEAARDTTAPPPTRGERGGASRDAADSNETPFTFTIRTHARKKCCVFSVAKRKTIYLLLDLC